MLLEIHTEQLTELQESERNLWGVKMMRRTTWSLGFLTSTTRMHWSSSHRAPTGQQSLFWLHESKAWAPHQSPLRSQRSQVWGPPLSRPLLIMQVLDLNPHRQPELTPASQVQGLNPTTGKASSSCVGPKLVPHLYQSLLWSSGPWQPKSHHGQGPWLCLSRWMKHHPSQRPPPAVMAPAGTCTPVEACIPAGLHGHLWSANFRRRYWWEKHSQRLDSRVGPETYLEVLESLLRKKGLAVAHCGG